MSWVRLDDLFPEHRKATTAGDSACWLFVAGLCYCQRNDTDGLIVTAQVQRLTTLRKPFDLAAKLVDVVLWEVVEDGFQVHNYADYQFTKAEKEQRRGNTRKRVQKHRSNGVTSTDVTPSHAGAGDGIGIVVAVEEPETVVASDERRLAELLFSLILERDPKAKEPNWDQWERDMRLLLADRHGDANEAEDVLRWSQTDSFWQTNILSPGKFRKQYTQLLLRMTNTKPALSVVQDFSRFQDAIDRNTARRGES